MIAEVTIEDIDEPLAEIAARIPLRPLGIKGVAIVENTVRDIVAKALALTGGGGGGRGDFLFI